MDVPEGGVQCEHFWGNGGCGGRASQVDSCGGASPAESRTTVRSRAVCSHSASEPEIPGPSPGRAALAGGSCGGCRLLPAAAGCCRLLPRLPGGAPADRALPRGLQPQRLGAEDSRVKTWAHGAAAAARDFQKAEELPSDPP